MEPATYTHADVTRLLRLFSDTHARMDVSDREQAISETLALFAQFADARERRGSSELDAELVRVATET